MYSIPGTYGIRWQVSRKRVYYLVNIKQVKQLTIEVHGSVENLQELKHPGVYATDTAIKKFWDFKIFWATPLKPPGCDMLRSPEKSNVAEDDFGGIASIRFPYSTEAGG